MAVCSFNRGNPEGTSLLKIYVCCLYVLSYVCVGIGFVGWLEKGFTYIWEVFRNVHSLMMEVDCPVMILCDWQCYSLTNKWSFSAFMWLWIWQFLVGWLTCLTVNLGEQSEGTCGTFKHIFWVNMSALCAHALRSLCLLKIPCLLFDDKAEWPVAWKRWDNTMVAV